VSSPASPTTSIEVASERAARLARKVDLAKAKSYASRRRAKAELDTYRARAFALQLHGEGQRHTS
jgi:hypothetical protein